MEYLNLLLIVCAISLSLYLLTYQKNSQRIISEEALIKKKTAKKIIRYLILYIAIISGMISVAIFKSIKDKGSFEITRIRYDFILALFVSPIVFKATLSNIFEHNYLKVCLLGYQNGFFWQTIFSEVDGSS